MPEVDAHELGGVTVGPDGEDRGAGPGAVEDGPKNAGQHQGHRQTPEADVGDDDASEAEPASGIGRSDGAKITRENQQQQADDHEVDAERQQEGEEERRPDHAVDHASLERVTDDEECDRIDRQAQEWVDVQAGEEIPRDVRADDYQRAMRQVHDVEDAPDQTEPEGDGDVNAPKQEAQNDLLGELAHELSLAGELPA